MVATRRSGSGIAAVVTLVLASFLAGASFPGQDAAATGAPLDTIPPQVLAMGATGVANQRMRLIYRVWDNSGHASVLASIHLGKRLLDRQELGVRPVGFFYVYWWPKATGSFRYCVSATDATGNNSAISCTKILVLRKW